MKQTTFIGIATSLLLASSAFAANDIHSAFAEGRVSGTLKTVYMDTQLDTTTIGTKNASSLAVGGYLKYQTSPLYGINGGITFMTTNGLGRTQGNVAQIFGGTANGGGEDDPTVLMNGKSGSVLGEAYLQYTVDKTMVKVGRQQLDTPLAGSKETRMLPTTFEAGVITNSNLSDTTVIGAIVTGQKERQSDRFLGMGRSALSNSTTSGTGTLGGLSSADIAGTGKTLNTATADANALQNAYDSKVYAGGVVYKGISGTTLQSWDYYATDILNAVYLQADYAAKYNDINIFLGAQYLDEKGVGSFNKIFGKGVNTRLWGIKAGTAANGLKLTVAYTQVPTDSQSGNIGSVILPWDGTPAFTDGANSNNLAGISVIDGKATIYGGSYAAGSQNTKIQLDYDFATFGVNGLTGLISYAKYDRSNTKGLNTTITQYDVNEWNIMMKYLFSDSLKGLSLIGMIIPMDISKADGESSASSADTSSRVQYRSFVTYSF